MVTSRLASAIQEGSLMDVERMLKWWMLLPRLLLRSPAGQGRRSTRMHKIHRRLCCFAQGHYDLLLKNLDADQMKKEQRDAKQQRAAAKRSKSQSMHRNKIISRALTLSQELQYSKATASLLSNGIADLDEHLIIEQLRQKHPLREKGLGKYPIDEYNRLDVDAEKAIRNLQRHKAADIRGWRLDVDVEKAIRNLQKHKPADIRGWRNEYLFRSAQDPNYGPGICQHLKVLVNYFIYGDMPDHMKTALNVGFLMGLIARI